MSYNTDFDSRAKSKPRRSVGLAFLVLGIGSLLAVWSFPTPYVIERPGPVFDVLGKDKAAEIMKGAVKAKITTFDGFTYTIKVGAADGENHFISYTIDGKFEETRTPPEPKEKDKPAETEEEKKKADEAFATALAAKKKKLTEEQATVGRIFSIAKSSLEPILKKRPDFMKDKPAAVAPGTPATDPEFGNKPPLPAPGGPRIEAVTPPISVETPPAK